MKYPVIILTILLFTIVADSKMTREPSSGSFQCKMQLKFEGRDFHWSGSGPTKTAAIQDAANECHDQLRFKIADPYESIDVCANASVDQCL